jgi:hypothetical protein
MIFWISTPFNLLNFIELWSRAASRAPFRTTIGRPSLTCTTSSYSTHRLWPLSHSHFTNNTFIVIIISCRSLSGAFTGPLPTWLVLSPNPRNLYHSIPLSFPSCVFGLRCFASFHFYFDYLLCTLPVSWIPSWIIFASSQFRGDFNGSIPDVYANLSKTLLSLCVFLLTHMIYTKNVITSSNYFFTVTFEPTSAELFLTTSPTFPNSNLCTNSFLHFYLPELN